MFGWGGRSREKETNAEKADKQLKANDEGRRDEADATKAAGEAEVETTATRRQGTRKEKVSAHNAKAKMKMEGGSGKDEL